MAKGPSAVPVQSSTTATQSLSPEQQQLVSAAMPAALNYAQNPPKLYPTSTIAPVDPLQTQAQNMALGQTGAINQLNASSGKTIGSLMSGGANAGNSASMSFLNDPKMMYANSNPYLSSAIQAATTPITQNFQNTVLPGIRSSAITSGQFGGSRQGIAEGNASGNYLRQIGDIASSMANENYQNSLGALVSGAGLGNQSALIKNNAMTAGLGAVPGQIGNLMMPAQITGAIGDQRQAVEQAKLTEAAMRFLAEQTMPFQAAQDVAQLAFGIPAGSTQTNSVGTQTVGGTGGQAGQIIGGIGGVALGAAAIF